MLNLQCSVFLPHRIEKILTAEQNYFKKDTPPHTHTHTHTLCCYLLFYFAVNTVQYHINSSSKLS